MKLRFHMSEGQVLVYPDWERRTFETDSHGDVQLAYDKLVDESGDLAVYRDGYWWAADGNPYTDVAISA